jgi:hypothetical protein
MKNINIWLDDYREPGLQVAQLYKEDPWANAVWVWVKTVQAFKAAIHKEGLENIGLVALDHDLGLCDQCKQDENNGTFIQSLRLYRGDHLSYPSCVHNGDGTELVEWMEAKNRWPKQRPHVHSFNHDGRLRMEQIITRHYGKQEAASWELLL